MRDARGKIHYTSAGLPSNGSILVALLEAVGVEAPAEFGDLAVKIGQIGVEDGEEIRRRRFEGVDGFGFVGRKGEEASLHGGDGFPRGAVAERFTVKMFLELLEFFG